LNNPPYSGVQQTSDGDIQLTFHGEQTLFVPAIAKLILQQVWQGGPPWLPASI
jgi:hypothetical protein